MTIQLAEPETTEIARLKLAGRLAAGDDPQRLRRTVEQLLRDGVERIDIDLTAVSYVDSAGLGELIACSTRAREAGRSFRVVAASPGVSTLLRITRTDRVLCPE